MDARTRKALITVAAASLAAACSLVVPKPGPPVPGRAGVFPHAIHVADGGMACADCHELAEGAAHAGMPGLDLCWSCHDEAGDPATPLARQPAGFRLEGDPDATWSAVTASSVPTQFSHAVHQSAGLECESCHPGVADSDSVQRAWKVGMPECLDCHDENGVDVGGCAGCHLGLDETTPPASHADPSWRRTHGPFGAEGVCWGAAPAMDCALCHRESSCDSCHQRTPPADHTEPWRVRGHGFSAALERERCDTCHKEDSCDRCHSTAEPVTHGGIWGGGTSAHCGSCHLPLGSDESCATCHRGTPSHRSAPARPGSPHPGASADCRSCHVPLDHFDNGQACTLCHR